MQVSIIRICSWRYPSRFLRGASQHCPKDPISQVNFGLNWRHILRDRSSRLYCLLFILYIHLHQLSWVPTGIICFLIVSRVSIFPIVSYSSSRFILISRVGPPPSLCAPSTCLGYLLCSPIFLILIPWDCCFVFPNSDQWTRMSVHKSDKSTNFIIPFEKNFGPLRRFDDTFNTSLPYNTKCRTKINLLKTI